MDVGKSMEIRAFGKAMSILLTMGFMDANIRSGFFNQWASRNGTDSMRRGFARQGLGLTKYVL
jgi:hypothetical protein